MMISEEEDDYGGALAVADAENNAQRLYGAKQSAMSWAATVIGAIKVIFQIVEGYDGDIIRYRSDLHREWQRWRKHRAIAGKESGWSVWAVLRVKS